MADNHNSKQPLHRSAALPVDPRNFPWFLKLAIVAAAIAAIVVKVVL
jgi:hypothetical protein